MMDIRESRDKSKIWEVLVAWAMFNPENVKMRDGVLMFTKAANWIRMQ